MAEDRTKEHEQLRQAVWDARAIMGFDNDGDPTPAAVVDLHRLVLTDAQDMRDRDDEAIASYEALEARLEHYKLWFGDACPCDDEKCPVGEGV